VIYRMRSQSTSMKYQAKTSMVQAQ